MYPKFVEIFTIWLSDSTYNNWHLIWKVSDPIDCEVDFLLENPIGSSMSGMKLVDQKEIIRSQMRRISK